MLSVVQSNGVAIGCSCLCAIFFVMLTFYFCRMAIDFDANFDPMIAGKQPTQQWYPRPAGRLPLVKQLSLGERWRCEFEVYRLKTCIRSSKSDNPRLLKSLCIYGDLVSSVDTTAKDCSFIKVKLPDESEGYFVSLNKMWRENRRFMITEKGRRKCLKRDTNKWEDGNGYDILSVKYCETKPVANAVRKKSRKREREKEQNSEKIDEGNKKGATEL